MSFCIYVGHAHTQANYQRTHNTFEMHAHTHYGYMNVYISLFTSRYDSKLFGLGRRYANIQIDSIRVEI